MIESYGNCPKCDQTMEGRGCPYCGYKEPYHKTYIALLSQASGCDYTIGCGMKWTELEATDMAGAIAELKNRVIGSRDDDYTSGYDGSYWHEAELVGATILEVFGKYEVPIPDWYRYAREVLANDKQRKTEETERQEYERLKAKFSQTEA